jgi:hypothetical protein
MLLNLSQNYSRFAFVWISVFGLIAVLHSSPVQAYPVLGQDIYYHGGSLQFEVLAADSAYISQIYLHTSTGNVFLGNNRNTGVVINIGDPTAIGLNPEDEFVLGIHVINTGNDFFMGGGYDNPDGVVHAAVNYGPNQTAIIGFEDLLGGGDLDYNDAMIKVLGNIGFTSIPEPPSLILLGSGFFGLTLVIRFKQQDRKLIGV